MSRPDEESLDRDENGDRYLTFTLRGEACAIQLLNVKEVIAMTHLSSVPQSPAYFKGILNLRGTIVSVYDLATMLRMPPREASKEPAIVILNYDSCSIGIAVDSVENVLVVDASEISPPPSMGTRDSAVSGVVRAGDKLILLIDLSVVLNACGADLKTKNIERLA